VQNKSINRAGVLIGSIAVGAATAVGARAQTSPLRFAFDTGTPETGWTTVGPTAIYSAERGFGFEPGEVVETTEGAATSARPFRFSVRLPEGNYTVTLTLGDRNGVSDTTVKAETRRLMLQNVATARGELVTRKFTVNIRTPKIAGGGGVHLKPREIGPPLNPNWDDKLTLEFNGNRPYVDRLEIAPAPNATTVFITGDSTVTDQPGEPYAAWGQILPLFFKPDVAVANYAESGESLRSTLGAHRLDKVLSVMKPGDYLFIQFGHNDQKEKGPGDGAFTSYAIELKTFVDRARAKGGLPVLITPMNRRRFDADGHLVPTLGDFPEAVRRVARAENVPLIDLNAMSKTLFEAMGPEGTLKAFVHYPAESFPGQTAALRDDTHFNSYGAYELARCVIEGMRAAHLPLTNFLRMDAGTFDPARPDPVSAWRLPMSPTPSAAKPDGS
jgi:lysophospholipase L1-like esterase